MFKPPSSQTKSVRSGKLPCPAERWKVTRRIRLEYCQLAHNGQADTNTGV